MQAKEIINIILSSKIKTLSSVHFYIRTPRLGTILALKNAVFCAIRNRPLPRINKIRRQKTINSPGRRISDIVYGFILPPIMRKPHALDADIGYLAHPAALHKRNRVKMAVFSVIVLNGCPAIHNRGRVSNYGTDIGLAILVSISILGMVNTCRGCFSFGALKAIYCLIYLGLAGLSGLSVKQILFLDIAGSLTCGGRVRIRNRHIIILRLK